MHHVCCEARSDFIVMWLLSVAGEVEFTQNKFIKKKKETRKHVVFECVFVARVLWHRVARCRREAELERFQTRPLAHDGNRLQRRRRHVCHFFFPHWLAEIWGGSAGPVRVMCVFRIHVDFSSPFTRYLCTGRRRARVWTRLNNSISFWAFSFPPGFSFLSRIVTKFTSL